MITIKEIARLANVSQSTVSKALNNRPDISANTRRKILELAEYYDFSPNAFGKGLKSRTTGNLGVIFCREQKPLSGNPFYSRVLEGIEGEVAVNNCNLILQLLSVTHPVVFPKMVREGQVDGVILVGNIRKEFIQLIQNSNTPLILIDPSFQSDQCHQILIDNEHGAFTATSYLITNGHLRIGFISSDISRLSFQQRLEGYLKALKFHGIKPDDSLIVAGGEEQGYEHVRRLLQLKKAPTAIFSANDINAILGYNAARDMNYRIPEDLSLIGFDDIDLAKMVSPPLSTIRVYKEELGSIAIRMLLKIVKGEDRYIQKTVVPVKLIERSSVYKRTGAGK
jgi:LacI family transcriptional regulator